jgi:hypothetical protein
MRTRFVHIAILAGMIGTILAPVTRADIQYFRAILNGAQEGSGGTCTDTGSPATGTAWFALNTDTNLVNYSVVFSGLVAPESGAHVHGTATACNAAGILFGLPLGNPKIGSYSVSAGQKADMQNGLHYINIHSNTHPGGEIRGQILQVTAGTMCFKANLDAEQESPGGGACSSTGSPATGFGTFRLDMASREVEYNISFSGLTAAESAAHVHGPALPCFNAPPLATGTLPSGTPKVGSYVITEAQVLDMLNELHYTNIHSSNFPAGEIRGQMVHDPACVPAMSEWGLTILVLLTLAAGTVVILRGRSITPV